MSAIADINQLLRPTVLTSLRENMPPVICNIWKGGDDFEKVTLNEAFPFDTVDTIKRIISTRYKDDIAFIPDYVFMAIRIEFDEGRYRYTAADYTWFPSGKGDAIDTIMLFDPRKSIVKPDKRFVTPTGSFPTFDANYRGRSTIEDVFLNLVMVKCQNYMYLHYVIY